MNSQHHIEWIIEEHLLFYDKILVSSDTHFLIIGNSVISFGIWSLFVFLVSYNFKRTNPFEMVMHHKTSRLTITVYELQNLSINITWNKTNEKVSKHTVDIWICILYVAHLPFEYQYWLVRMQCALWNNQPLTTNNINRFARLFFLVHFMIGQIIAHKNIVQCTVHTHTIMMIENEEGNDDVEHRFYSILLIILWFWLENLARIQWTRSSSTQRQFVSTHTHTRNKEHIKTDSRDNRPYDSFTM